MTIERSKHAGKALEKIDELAEPYRFKGSEYAAVVREVARQAELTIREYEQTRAHELEAYEKVFKRASELEKSRTKTLERQLADLQSSLRVEQEASDQGIITRFAAPKSKHGYPRAWTLGELEQVVYNLRLAGGTDHTEVRIKHDHTEACVPFPEMVLTRPEPLTPEPLEFREPEFDQPRPSVPSTKPMLAMYVAVALALCLLIATIARTY